MTTPSRFVTLSSLYLFLAACGESDLAPAGPAANPDAAATVQADTLVGSGTAADYTCLDNKVDYVLSTEVVDFEMKGGGGLNAGISPNGISLTSINIGVNYSQGTLQTMMHLADPLKPGVPVVDVGGAAVDQNITFSLNVSAALATFGPSFWYSTPASTLSMNALTNNLAALNQDLNAIATNEWWTTVTQINGTKGFFIPAGSTAGIQAGDEFKVMDVSYIWSGDGRPCKNELIMPLLNHSAPKAYARAVNVGLDYTYLAFVGSKKAVAPHDYVTVQALMQTKFLQCPTCSDASPRALSRSIRIGGITAPPLVIAGQGGLSQSIDIGPFVRDQLQTLLPKQEFGDFYLHQ